MTKLATTMAAAALFATAAAAQDSETPPAADVFGAEWLRTTCLDDATAPEDRESVCEDAIEAQTARVEGDYEYPAMALALRAELRARLGRYDAAIADIDQALATDADYLDRAALTDYRAQIADLIVQAGAGRDTLRAAVDLYNAGGDAAEIARLATEALDQGLAADADVVTALQARAGARVALQEWSFADEDLTRIIELGVDDPAHLAEVHRQRAAIALAQGDLAAALTDYDSALAAQPGARILVERGDLLLADGLSGDAAFDYEAALADPDAPQAYRDLAQLGLAKTWHDVGDVGEAMPAYEAFFARLSGAEPAAPEVQRAALDVIQLLRDAGHYVGDATAYDAELQTALRACIEDSACRSW